MKWRVEVIMLLFLISIPTNAGFSESGEIIVFEDIFMEKWKSAGESWEWSVYTEYIEIKLLGTELGETAGYLMLINPTSSEVSISYDSWWRMSQTRYIDRIQYFPSLSPQYPYTYDEFRIPVDQNRSNMYQCYNDFEDMEKWCRGTDQYTGLTIGHTYYLLIILRDRHLYTDDKQVVRFQNIELENASFENGSLSEYPDPSENNLAPPESNPILTEALIFVTFMLVCLIVSYAWLRRFISA